MVGGHQKKEVIGWVLAIFALGVFGVSSMTILPRADKTLSSEIGRRLALEAIEMSKPGGKVTVIARDTEAFRQIGMSAALAAIEAELKRAGREIRSVERIQLDPIRPSEVPSGDFYDLLRRLPADNVVISLLGPPALLPEEREKLGAPKAKVVAMCTGSLAQTVSIEELFRAGLLHAAILNKPGAPATNEFEQLYMIIRP